MTKLTDHLPPLLTITMPSLERVELGSTLHSSEEKFAKIFAHSPDAMAISDKTSGAFIEINAGFERQFGWSKAQALGRTSTQLGLWVDPGERQRMLDTLTKEGRLSALEACLQDRDARRSDNLIYGSEMELDGRPCLVLTVRDVTRPRAQARALQDSEERLSLALESANLGTWDWDIPNHSIYASVRTSVLHGLAATPFHGDFKNFYQQVPMADREAMRQAYLKLLQNQRSDYQMSYRARLANGELHYLESTARLYRDAQGAPLRMTGTLMDITERTLREQRLAASEAKFAKAFHSSPDAIMITERDNGRYIEVNEGFCRLSGYTAEEVIGRTADELNAWADASQRQLMLEKLAREGRVQRIEMLGRNRLGNPVLAEVSVEPLDLDGLACLLITARDISELKKAQAQVRHLAYHDSLTNLPNRALLMDRLAQQIALFKRHALRGALLFLDLDHFKLINDSLGHPVGDAVLKLITARLEASVRQEDTVARLGGDEFVVLLSCLEGTSAQVTHRVLQVAEKLRLLLAEPMFLDGQQLQVTPSIGIALIPDHGATPDDLLKRADIALYRAKDAGRNAIQLFRSSMQHAASERLRLENDLRQALIRGEFELYFQPQLDARSGQIIGAEALLRWQHPTLGAQSPAVFIQVLEESGLILEVGSWVLAEACRACAQLFAENRVQAEKFSLCVNISPRQFRQHDFVEQVQGCLQSSHLPPAMLKLEITEGIVIQNIDDTIAKMRRLKREGVSFAMDDFGTGYSSLTYLKRLPVDVLKIDQSFVRDAISGPHDTEIIRAIVAMAHSLGLKMIAEGVEQQAQLDFLQQLGCHLYQGYLFSKAVPLDEFRALLAQSEQRPLPA